MTHSPGRLLILCAIVLGFTLVLRLSGATAFLTPATHGAPVVGLRGAASAQGDQLAAQQQGAGAELAAALPFSAVALLAFGVGAAVRSRHGEARRGVSSKCRQTRVAQQARGGAAGDLVVIAGPPAAGKGTQCERIKEKFGYIHISTGDILRANVKEGTELGKKAEEYMTAGKLVPSELIVDLVKDRLAQDDVKAKGCLLDGFPRAPDQAKAMVDAGLKVDKFVLIEVPDDTLVERGCGRRLDPETGDIYHLKFKPPPAEIADRLVHRSDDQETAIRERLAIYHEQVNGILPFFESVTTKIDGLPKPDEVTKSVFAALE